MNSTDMNTVAFVNEIREICNKFSVVLHYWRDQKLSWLISQVTTILEEADEINEQNE